MKHNCVVCIYNDRVVIVGPFPDHKALTHFGRRWQLAHGDDPRWQSVYLADPARGAQIIAPDAEGEVDFNQLAEIR